MRISVAIATYNGDRFLREQLDSLYRQTRLPDEVVVSDDGSTDTTMVILEEYHQRYGLIYLHNTCAKGVNGNFESALRMTTGNLVCLCDQDDVWLNNKIETLYAAISNQPTDIPVAVSSSRIDVDQDGHEIGRPRIETTGNQWYDTLLHTGCSQGCTMMLNRCLVDRMLQLYATNPNATCYLYDVLASVTAAIFGRKINLPDRLMHYRHHDRNVVDPMRVGRYTFWQRVHDMPTYYPFLLDYRIHELAQTNILFSDESKTPVIQDFLDKMSLIDQTDNIFRGLRIICSLSEINRALKWKTLLLTPAAKILKIIDNAYHQHSTCQ